MTWARSNAPPSELAALVEHRTSVPVADDQRWILALIRRQGPRVVSMLWRMLGIEADVLDAYQSAICNLTAHGPGPITRNRPAYFYRAAMNAAIELLRRRRRERVHWPELVSAVGQRQETESPETFLDHAAAIEQLREAICQLPPQLRGVIVLRDLAELPYRQVARILNVGVSTARLYRRRAILRLATLLDEEDKAQ